MGDDVESRITSLERRVAQQEAQNMKTRRLGPKPVWDDPEWIEAGNRLAEQIVGEVTRRKNMTTRCKFKCDLVRDQHVSLSPVYSGSEENKQFFDATPNGLIQLGLYREDVFEPGVDYYVDFTRAGQEQAG